MEQELLRINILREQVLPKGTNVQISCSQLLLVIWRRVRHLAGGHIGALSALLLIINGKNNDAAFDRFSLASYLRLLPTVFVAVRAGQCDSKNRTRQFCATPLRSCSLHGVASTLMTSKPPTTATVSSLVW